MVVVVNITIRLLIHASVWGALLWLLRLYYLSLILIWTPPPPPGDVLQQRMSTSCSRSISSSSVFGALPGRSRPPCQQAQGRVEVRHHLWMRRAFPFLYNHKDENHVSSSGVCIIPQKLLASCWWPEWSLWSSRWGAFLMFSPSPMSTFYTYPLLLSFQCCGLQLSFDHKWHKGDIKWYWQISNVALVVKAKDKDQWQKLFSHFCSRAANEEEEIAHKLLGEQFRVSLFVRARLSGLWMFRHEHDPALQFPLGAVVSIMLLMPSFSSSSRVSWPCYTTFSKQHFMTTISVG